MQGREQSQPRAAVAYILSANINRRHMTKGQRAMAVAKILPEPESGGRGNHKGYCDSTVSKQRLSYARTVLRFAPDLAMLFSRAPTVRWL